MNHSPRKGCRQEFGNNKIKNKIHNYKSNVDICKDMVGDKMFNKGMNRNSESGLGLKEKLKEMENIERRGRLIEPIFLDASEVEVEDLITIIDKGTILVEEVSNNLLNYEYPCIRMQATVKIPSIPLGTNIQVGWIQVVTEMKQINLFENNDFTSWQLPKLVNGEQKMVNDSYGTLFPWAEVEKGLIYWEGPIIGGAEGTIGFLDSPCALISMFMPMDRSNTEPTLKFIYRKQNFYSYLVLKNFLEDKYQILKAIEWHMEVAIGIDVTKPLGERVVFVGPCEPKSPKILSREEIPSLEKYALETPAVNDCQILVGRCNKKPIEVLKRPTVSNIDVGIYLFETKDYCKKLLKITQENYLLQKKFNS